MTKEPAPFEHASRIFEANMAKVRALLSFDTTVLQFAIPMLERIRASQDNSKPRITNARHRVDKVIELLSNIHENESLQPTYRTIYNQALVLAVSYFAATLRDIFKVAITRALMGGTQEALFREEVKLTMGELLRVLHDPSDKVADVLIAKKDLSFQDMKSIGRAFHDLCGFAPDRDKTVNDIIVAQACRHAIVHAGAIVDRKLVQQVSKATPRSLNVILTEGNELTFSIRQVELACDAMTSYLEVLIEGLYRKQWMSNREHG